MVNNADITGAPTYFLFWQNIWSNTTEYNKDTMTYLTTRQRAIFFTIFLLLYATAALGNLAAIITTYRRKHRYIQKCLIISLAITDIIMATAYAVQYVETFSHSLVKWTMGEVMCYLIPFLQIFGVTASSMAIVIIAIDRYRSAVHATMKRWNPTFWTCLFGVSVLWSIAAGLAYPIWILLQHKEVVIISEDEYGNTEYEEGFICIAPTRTDLLTYYICIIITIFFPLVIMVSWLYFNIFKLVYKSKKSITENNTVTNSQNNANGNSNVQLNSANETVKSILKNRNDKSSVMVSKRSFHVQRRIRIFKIMIFLMMAFLLCRSPYWIYSIIQLNITAYNTKDWITTCLLSALSLSDCILNPFLYTFLPQTMSKVSKVWKAFSDFTCEVCCCCCSTTEFEQFEKENPFCVENYNKQYNQCLNKNLNKSQRVKFEETITDQHIKNRKY